MDVALPHDLLHFARQVMYGPTFESDREISWDDLVEEVGTACARTSSRNAPRRESAAPSERRSPALRRRPFLTGRPSRCINIESNFNSNFLPRSNGGGITPTMRLGVSTFSLTNEWLSPHAIRSVLLGRVAELGLGRGLEVIGHQSWRGYPDFSTARTSSASAGSASGSGSSLRPSATSILLPAGRRDDP